MPCGLPQASACPLFPPPLPPLTPLARARLTQLPHLVDLGKPLFIHPSNGTITSPPHRLVGASMQRGGGVACPSATHTLSPHVTSTPFLCIFAHVLSSAPTITPLNPSNPSRPQTTRNHPSIQPSELPQPTLTSPRVTCLAHGSTFCLYFLLLLLLSLKSNSRMKKKNPLFGTFIWCQLPAHLILFRQPSFEVVSYHRHFQIRKLELRDLQGLMQSPTTQRAGEARAPVGLIPNPTFLSTVGAACLCPPCPTLTRHMQDLRQPVTIHAIAEKMKRY